MFKTYKMKFKCMCQSMKNQLIYSEGIRMHVLVPDVLDIKISITISK